MARADALGLFWQDQPLARGRGSRTLGPMPDIPETGWMPATEFPNIAHAPWISLDTETWDPEIDQAGPGWARGRGHIVGVSLAVPQGKWYFPMRHTVQRHMNMDPQKVLSWLRYVLGHPQPKIGAHLLYDLGWLAEEGVEVKGKLYDCQYAEALLDETARLNLDDLGYKYLRRGKTTHVLRKWAYQYYATVESKWRGDIYRCPPTLVGPYAEDDAQMPQEILTKQWPQMARRGLLDLFEMECKLMRLLLHMRFKGVTVDVQYAEHLREDLIRRMAQAQEEAEYILGREINVGSGQQLEAAFDDLGLQYARTAKGNASFTQDSLKQIKHPFVEKLLLIRALDKIKGTFVESYVLNSHVNGKIYGTFHPLMGEAGGAKTGRFSSSDPNLQNIPVRTAEGKHIRRMFVKDIGHRRFRSFDYSQIEYRMLMHFAVGPGADEFRQRYHTDPTLDFHKMTGQMITEHTGQTLERSYIKNVNFGTIYGVGIYHMAEMLGVSLEDAKALLNHYHTALPFAKATMKAVADDIQETGVCRTILNRQTHFNLWESAKWGEGGDAMPYRDARESYGDNIMRAYTYKGLNYKLQGSAADIMKKAMVDCWEAGVFDVIGVPRMTVHDELDFSDDGEAPDEAWEEMKHICESCIPLKVPIRMDGIDGENWAECKD